MTIICLIHRNHAIKLILFSASKFINKVEVLRCGSEDADPHSHRRRVGGDVVVFVQNEAQQQWLHRALKIGAKELV